MLIHFPIALVVIAVTAEGVATANHEARWHTLAVGNLRAGALFAIAAVVAGWRLAAAGDLNDSTLFEWHRWLGTSAAVATLLAAVATAYTEGASTRRLWAYRTALFVSGLLVAVTGHLGGMLVWGADFFRP